MKRPENNVKRRIIWRKWERERLDNSNILGIHGSIIQNTCNSTDNKKWGLYVYLWVLDCYKPTRIIFGK